MTRSLSLFLSAGLVAGASLLSAPATAQSTRLVDTARLTLGALLPSVPDDVAKVDLGPAPPPGAVRAFSRRQLERKLRGLGVAKGQVRLPRVLRVKSAVKLLKPGELAELARPAIKKALKSGIQLLKVRPRSTLRVPPRMQVGTVTLPKPRRRVGRQRTTAMVAISLDDHVVQRVPIPVTLRVSAAALRYDVAKGARVKLVIEHGTARISAIAAALAGGDVGDVILFRVVRTRKTLRAKVLSRHTARVVEL